MRLFSSCCWVARPISSDSNPTRPTNMAMHKSSFEEIDKSAVMPNEEPTVNNADADSKARSFTERSGSKITRIKVSKKYDKMESPMTALARLIDITDRVRPKTVIYFLFVTIDLRLSSIAANVFTLIPPAVDCDAPPIHIKNIINRSVAGRNDTGLTDANPELLGIDELK